MTVPKPRDRQPRFPRDNHPHHRWNNSLLPIFHARRRNPVRIESFQTGCLMSQKKTARFELKSGTVDALLFSVRTTDMAAMREELTQRFAATPEFFSNDIVAIDVRPLEDGETVALDEVADLLRSLQAHPVGVVARPEQHGWASQGGLPVVESQSSRRPARKEPPASAAPAPATAAPAASVSPPVPLVSPGTMLIDKPLRSGQQIYAKGDLVILDLVSYGAEVMAEGNIYVYAPLRGRALAGVRGNTEARIFCTCLEPELISIAGIYRTSEQPFPDTLLGKPVQIRLADDKLILEPLRMK